MVSLGNRQRPLLSLTVTTVVLLAAALVVVRDAFLFAGWNPYYNDNAQVVTTTTLQQQPPPLAAVLCSSGPKNEDLEYCEAHNFIPDAMDTVVEPRNATRKPFSIRRQDFLPHHERKCQSTKELLHAIQFGQRRRHFGDTHNTTAKDKQYLTPLQREEIPSTFVPAGCDIPHYNAKQICDVLNRFSHVVFQGDSLSRHQQGGLIMSLRNDLVRGSVVSSNLKHQHQCRCDGQFSESKLCRNNDGLYNRFRPYQLGLCPELDVANQFESVFTINRLHKGVYKFDGVDCTAPDSKGILVVVQGGVHMKYNAASTYARLIRRFFDDPIFRVCADHHKAMLLWVGFHVQSTTNNDKYPEQALAKQKAFDSGIADLLSRDQIVNATSIPMVNFTSGAMYTDGVHYAANVNYFKVQLIVALADRMYQEQQWISYPRG